MDSAQPVTIWGNKHDRYILVHAILGSLAALITAPAAILIARYFRHWRYWNYAHIALNALTAAFIVITFALGNAAVGPPYEYSGDGADVHHQLGLAIFIITMVQTIMGIGALFTKRPSYNAVTLQKGRSALRFIHIAFGIATAAILYAQVYTGFDEWDQTSKSQTTVPRGITIAFWVLFSVEIFAYIVGWVVMEPLARRQHKAFLDLHPEMKEGGGSRMNLMSENSR